VTAIDSVQVDMWLGAVPGISTSPQRVANMYALADPNLDAVLLKMAHGNHGAGCLDQYMISGEAHPTRSGSATLSQRVANRWQAAVGLVIGLGLVRGHDNALDRRQQRASKAWKPVGPFRAHQGR
jgi:hypothetical protein